MADGDIEAASLAQFSAFDDLDQRLGLPREPLDDARRQRMRSRYEHFVTHDPGGAWVGLVDGRVAGAALALRRGTLWGLSLLIVDPTLQSGGLGRRLIDASLTYAEGCDRAVILSSEDPRAMRTYATSGFDLFPQVWGEGPPDRTALPALGGRVRDGSPADAEWADEVDLAVRGATRGPDHAALATDSVMFVVADSDGRGYAYVRPSGDLAALAASDDDTATALLWRGMAHAADAGTQFGLRHVNGGQQWAIRAAYQARILLKPDGPVFYRGMTPPPSYLPSGAYL
jgi:GNAT superfamily N-acetyltransferase